MATVYMIHEHEGVPTKNDHKSAVTSPRPLNLVLGKS